jgi:hypothetical protein
MLLPVTTMSKLISILLLMPSLTMTIMLLVMLS